MIRLFLLASLILFMCPLCAQQINISGMAYDNESKLPLPGVKIYSNDKSKAVLSDSNGFYSLTIPYSNELYIIAEFEGYKKLSYKPYKRESELGWDFYLEGMQIEEIIVNAQGLLEEHSSISVESIKSEDIKLLPSFAGEPDIIKSLQLLPGLSRGDEARTGFYVRGGDMGQNLVLLDNVPLFGINHFGGFASLFNADAIDSAVLIKGAFPSQYGGKLSSVLAVSTQKLDSIEKKTTFQTGLFLSKLTHQAPIKKDTSAFLIGFRRFYTDILTIPITLIALGDITAGYGFYDFNFKWYRIINKRNVISFTNYFGDDFFNSRQWNGLMQYHKVKIKWGSKMTGFNWHKSYNSKLNSTITIGASQYRSELFEKRNFKIPSTLISKKSVSKFTDYHLKSIFIYNVHPDFKINFGSVSNVYQFLINEWNYSEKPSNTKIMEAGQRVLLYDNAFFAENTFRPHKNLLFTSGMRFSQYWQFENYKHFFEPRIYGKYRYNNLVFDASYSVTTQNIQKIMYSGETFVADEAWLPSPTPSKSEQYTAGISTKSSNKKYNFGMEAYYKNMTNLIELKQGKSIFNQSDFRSIMETDGIGKSKGLEFLVKKEKGKITGWVSYTLSRTIRQFENINNGQQYFFNYDRLHNLNVVFNYEIDDLDNFSATWVYSSGMPITLPKGYYYGVYTYDPDGTSPRVFSNGVDIYGGKNLYRTRDYHRLDFSYRRGKYKPNGGRRYWYLGVYNAYNRYNPILYSIDFELDLITSKTIRQLNEYSIFMFMPFFSYERVFR